MQAAILCLLVMLIPALEEDDPVRHHLDGLGALHVVVENLNADAKALGLTKERLKTDVELRLRGAGIPVGKSDPFLYVNLIVRTTAVTLRSGVHSANVHFWSLDLSLVDSGFLERKPFVLCDTTLWHVSVTGGSFGPPSRNVALRRETMDDLRRAIKDHTDAFCNLYLSANQQNRTGTKEAMYHVCSSIGMSDKEIAERVSFLSEYFATLAFDPETTGVDKQVLLNLPNLMLPSTVFPHVQACYRELAKEALQNVPWPGGPNAPTVSPDPPETP